MNASDSRGAWSNATRWIPTWSIALLISTPFLVGFVRADELAAELEKLFERKSGQISAQRRAEISELVSALNKDGPEVRQRTREDLLPYGRDATPFLLRLAGSPSHDESRAALVALAMIRDPDSVPFLEAELGEREHFVTLFAALALGEIGRPSSVAPLTGVLVDADDRDAYTEFGA